MKKILVMILCLCMFLVACSDETTVKNDGPISFDGFKGSGDAVMTVNGENVSVDEFNYYIIMSAFDLKSANNVPDDELDAFWSKTDSESGKTYAELAVEDAINDCAVFHVYRTEALKQGITLTDDEKLNIENKANSMKTEYSEDMHYLQLKAGGLTAEVHRDITEMGYYSNKLYSKFVGDFREITVDEMDKFYRYNYVRAKHILVMTMNPETGEQHTEEQKQEAMKKVSEAYGKLEAGEDFDKLMAEYTEDTGYQTNPDGYTFTKDDEYVEGFKTTAFSLEEGAVSDIIQTEYGYHIIKREPLTDDFVEKNIEPLQEKIYSSEFRAMIDKWCGEAEIIGNKPVFDSIDVGNVLNEYLEQYDETLELIKQEFMKLNGDAE